MNVNEPPPQIQVLDARAVDQLVREPSSSEYVLDAHRRGITRIEGFGAHTRLRSLDLSFNQLSSLDHIGDLADLRELKVYGNRVSELDGLSTNGALEKLLAQDNAIQEIPSCLSSMQGLKVLRLDRNLLSSLSALSRTSCLVHLDVSSNSLTSLEGVKNLLKLEELRADHNEIKSLQSHLVDCKRLAELHLSYNHMSSLAGLKGLKALEVLYVRHNHLSTLDSLPLLINLTELYLDGNRLTSINRLAGAVPALDVLDIRDNRLESLEQVLSVLSGLENLRELQLGNNPCTPMGDKGGLGEWWNTCCQRLQQLERLEDRAVMTVHKGSTTTGSDDDQPADPPSLAITSPPQGHELEGLPPPPTPGTSRPNTASSMGGVAKGQPPLPPMRRGSKTEKLEALNHHLEDQVQQLKESMEKLRKEIRSQGLINEKGVTTNESPGIPPASSCRPDTSSSSCSSSQRLSSRESEGNTNVSGGSKTGSDTRPLSRALRFSQLQEQNLLQKTTPDFGATPRLGKQGPAVAASDSDPEEQKMDAPPPSAALDDNTSDINTNVPKERPEEPASAYGDVMVEDQLDSQMQLEYEKFYSEQYQDALDSCFPAGKEDDDDNGSFTWYGDGKMEEMGGESSDEDKPATTTPPNTVNTITNTDSMRGPASTSTLTIKTQPPQSTTEVTTRGPNPAARKGSASDRPAASLPNRLSGKGGRIVKSQYGATNCNIPNSICVGSGSGGKHMMSNFSIPNKAKDYLIKLDKVPAAATSTNQEPELGPDPIIETNRRH